MQGLLIIEPDVFGDNRGYFMESWNRQRYREAGIAFDFVQDNFSLSRRGTLRGLHFQNPLAQGKLVSVLQGEVYDVGVDIRRGSPTFGRWFGMTLSAENKRQFFLPPGFAHGFLVLSEMALFHYKCTDIYSPRDEQGFRWNDPDVGIKWPVANPILSKRDAAAPYLKAIPPGKLF
ncbi:MAG TPA: dTDP-4-dehydrorhamnose 3,5-epimerase [Opitutaceae bacterium]|nr:dTDP-4-dehydrorhamnose 3,5-epimerase [Opitutaceae bacterium]